MRTSMSWEKPETAESHNLQLRDESAMQEELARLAVRAAPNGWALIRRGRVCVTNPAFHRIDRSSAADGPWQRVAPRRHELDRPGSYSDLETLVVAEARFLRRSGRAVIRAQFARSTKSVDVRLQFCDAYSDSVLVFVQNVTKITQAEAKATALQASLQAQDKLRALGELTFGIAHDLNNVLGALSWRLALIERDVAFGHAQQTNVDALRRIAGAFANSVARIRSYARPSEAGLTSADLASIVSSSVEIAASSLRIREDGRPSVPIRMLLPELPKVVGCPGDLQHLFINLLLNARDAMPSGGTITIRGAREGDAVNVTVEDEGAGIAPDVSKRIFEPFFTTKGSKGTGLGLALAKATMRRCGGTISASNVPTGGARFELRFVPAP
jgi:signal transduction histidine kinase